VAERISPSTETPNVDNPTHINLGYFEGTCTLREGKGPVTAAGLSGNR